MRGIYIYIYIYIEGERESESEREINGQKERARDRDVERDSRRLRGRDTERSNVVEETADGGDYSGLKYSGIHAGKAADTDLYRSHLSRDRQRRHTATVVPSIA